jgi:heme oxygenase
MGAENLHAGLAERLRSETRTAHARAERAGLMSALLRGRPDHDTYCALLRNLYEIYRVLEPALTRHSNHPCVAPVHFPPLARSGALSADLRELYGARWAVALEVVPAAREYGLRLREIAESRPELLVAHAYTRYMGDLNGGQILRRIVVAALDLMPGTGTAFYEFRAVADLAAMVQRYRDALDRIPIDDALADDLVQEAQHAFGLHVRLFEELARAPAPCTVRGARGPA